MRFTNLVCLRPRRGSFPNGMTYARFGDGPRTLLWLAEGTQGPMLAMMARVVRPFVADGYSVWLVSLPSGMPNGHTLADMADDYAALIDDVFGGSVDLVVGHSTGGFIGYSVAARHPNRFAHIVIAGAGLWNERSDRANLEFSRLLVAGRRREAGKRSVRLLAPGIRPPILASVLGSLIAWAALATASAQDLRTTAEALHEYDPEQVLPGISVPVLLTFGDKDIYLDTGEIERVAQLIPDCTLHIYPGSNHFGAITSPHFAADTRAFIDHDPRAAA